jgi:hypothetical protein
MAPSADEDHSASSEKRSRRTLERMSVADRLDPALRVQPSTLSPSLRPNGLAPPDDRQVSIPVLGQGRSHIVAADGGAPSRASMRLGNARVTDRAWASERLDLVQ